MTTKNENQNKNNNKYDFSSIRPYLGSEKQKRNRELRCIVLRGFVYVLSSIHPYKDTIIVNRQQCVDL